MPPAQNLYPSPPSHPLPTMDDTRHSALGDMATPLFSDSAFVPDDNNTCLGTSPSYLPAISLPSPSSPWLDDDDFDHNRFDLEEGGFRVPSPSTGHSHQQHRDLESAFCRNFSCCGLNLRDLHDLLQHYEECHVRFEDDDDDSLSGEDGSLASPASHLHASTPLMLGQHHPPRYHRLTAISGTCSASLRDPMGFGIQLGATSGGFYDDDDSWSESDSNPPSPTPSSPSFSSFPMGATSPSFVSALQSAHAGSRSSCQLPFLTCPRDHNNASHALDFLTASFGPGLKRKAGVSLADIYAEDTLDHHLNSDAAFANTILRLRSSSFSNGHSFSASGTSSIDHLSAVALKKQALENSQRVNAAAVLLAQSNLNGADKNSLSTHAFAPQAQQNCQTFRPSASNAQPPFPLGHPQHPQTHPLARAQHPLVPSLSHPMGETPRLPFGTIPSVLMTSAHRNSMIPGPLQTSLSHPFSSDLTTAEILRQHNEAFSLIEDMSRNPGACSQGDKPYRCAVLGCDKAYKNPNGLKYHNQHGHCSSLGMCDTDAPGSKPYVCTFLECGKRYKNLNGLKYHIEHSHPNLTAALRAHQSGLMNNLLLYSPYPNQAAMTIAAALAAVQASPMMMAAANAILTAAANNNASIASSNGSGNSTGGNGNHGHNSSGNGNASSKHKSSENNSASCGPSPTPLSCTTPVTPVSAVPLTQTTTAATSFTGSSAPPTATTKTTLPPSAPGPGPGPGLGPVPVPPSSTTGLPTVPNGASSTIQLSSAPISAIPPMQPILSPQIPQMKMEENSIDADSEMETVLGGGSHDSTNGSNSSNGHKNKNALEKARDAHKPGSQIEDDTASKDCSSSSATLEALDGGMAAHLTAGRKSRGKHATALPLTLQLPSSSSPPSLSTAMETTTLAVNEKRDRRKVTWSPSSQKPEHTAKKSIVGSSVVEPTVTDAAAAAAATGDVSTASPTLASPTSLTNKIKGTAVPPGAKAATKTSDTLTRSSTSDTKSPASPSAPSTTTMVTRSNRPQHHQSQQPRLQGNKSRK